MLMKILSCLIVPSNILDATYQLASSNEGGGWFLHYVYGSSVNNGVRVSLCSKDVDNEVGVLLHLQRHHQ